MNVFDLFATLKLDTSDYNKNLDNAKKDTTSLKDALSNAGKTFASIGAGIGVAGGALFAFANNSSKSADEIDKMSQKVGMSAKAYQEWDYVLKISGTEMSSMTTGLKTLTNKFDDAVNGGSGAIETFERLGLSMEDIQGLSREDLFAAVITAFQGMEDSAERAALANDLFGKSGQELAPLFNTTAEETQNLIQQINDMGGVMSDDAVKNGAAFQDSMTALKTAFGGVTNSLAGELIPEITSLAGKITDFIASGGMTKLLDTLKALTPVIAGVTAAMIAYKASMAISGLITALTAATEGQTIAQVALNAVMNANPFVLLATAIIGVVTALGVLFATNEDFRNGVIEIWTAIKEFFAGVFGDWVDLITSLPEIFSKAWTAIKDTATAAFKAVAKFIGDKFDAIKKGAETLRNNVSTAFSNAKTNASNAWNDIKSRFDTHWRNVQSAFATIGSWFSTQFTTAKNNASNAWSDIKSKFDTHWNNIRNAFSTGATWFKTNFTTFKNNAVSAWNDIKSKFSTIFGNIKDAFNIGDAISWGRDLIDNFINGIKQKAAALKDELKGVADKVKSFLGFSEPEEGPLSNFHTYAPDMMDLFAKGIRDNTDVVTDQIAKSFDFSDSISGVNAGAGASTFNAGGVNINIYARDGQSAKAIADEIDYRIAKSVEAKKAVWGMS